MPAATAALQFDAARFEHEATQKLLCLTRFRPNIEFDREGTIFSASDLFTEMMGYSTEELLGQRHGIFVDATECNYGQQNDFWAKLCSGTPQTGEYKRLAKGGRQLWLASTYYPILDDDGQVYRILQFANDVTERKLRDAYFAAKLRQSIARSPSANMTWAGRWLPSTRSLSN